MEVWSKIEYIGNGFYSVSNYGRVKSNRICRGSIYGLMKQYKNMQGYYVVNITTDNKRRPYLVHRLIAEAFIKKIDGKKYVNHKNGKKDDNRIDNLEWVTCSENVKHGFSVLGRKGSSYGKFGAENHSSLPVNQINKDGIVLKRWSSITEAMKELSVSNISRSCKTSIKAGGYNWEYAKTK